MCACVECVGCGVGFEHLLMLKVLEIFSCLEKDLLLVLKRTGYKLRLMLCFPSNHSSCLGTVHRVVHD